MDRVTPHVLRFSRADFSRCILDSLRVHTIIPVVAACCIFCPPICCDFELIYPVLGFNIFGYLSVGASANPGILLKVIAKHTLPTNDPHTKNRLANASEEAHDHRWLAQDL
ncbi:hypothetical protein BC628DRAFT_1360757 [Trametes gibbosa]|nr:hypothetical protein BC628DRAFT_1360757 [Trametes gibbosa]